MSSETIILDYILIGQDSKRIRQFTIWVRLDGFASVIMGEQCLPTTVKQHKPI